MSQGSNSEPNIQTYEGALAEHDPATAYNETAWASFHLPGDQVEVAPASQQASGVAEMSGGPHIGWLPRGTFDFKPVTTRYGFFDKAGERRPSRLHRRLVAATLAITGIGSTLIGCSNGDVEVSVPSAITPPVIASPNDVDRAANPIPSDTAINALPSPTTTTSHEVTLTKPNLKPSVPLSSFAKLISQKAIIDSRAKYGDRFFQQMDLDTIMPLNQKNIVLSHEKIAEYQKYIKKVYANPQLATTLGDPMGTFDPEIMNGMPADGVARLVLATTDQYLSTIAQKVNDPAFNSIPGVDPSLVKLVSLNPVIRQNEAIKINSGVNNYPYAKDIHIVNVAVKQGISLIATMATYSDDSVRFTWSELIPVGAITPDLNKQSFVALAAYEGIYDPLSSDQ